MFYTAFVSASRAHLDWIRRELHVRLHITGHMTHASKSRIYQLKYAKMESLKILRKVYHDDAVICLNRKRLKIQKALGILNITL